MQRRRKPRSEPRNIFDKTSGGKPQKSPSKKHVLSTPTQPTPAKPNLPPPQITPKAKDTAPAQTTSEPTNQTEEEIIEETDDTILEEQVLGIPKRRSRGLTSVEEAPESTPELPNTSSKAMEIIEATKARASANATVEKQQKTTNSAPQKPAKPRRKPTPQFQPATKEKRLDRSRHMEYKYEVRGLLKDINVAEEYHSSLLGSIWAKGERQTAQDAKQFILDKQNEGIIDDAQAEKLISVVDDYTIRR